MRDYINRLSRGKFTYETPKISFESEQLALDIVAGRVNEASFKITASDTIKGIIYVSEPRVLLKENGFYGKNTEIEFSVDATKLADKEQLEGMFVIVSNAGEKEYPFVFNCVPESVDTSMGKAHDLFHFTNLYQKSVEEARAVFSSYRFTEVFLKGDEHLTNIYNILYDKNNINASMEEFVIAIKKKVPVELKVPDTVITFDAGSSDEKGTIALEKTGWGYITANVETDSDFIELSRNVITSEDFTGDVYELEFIVNKHKLHAGNNYGRISFCTYKGRQSVTVQIANAIDRNDWDNEEKKAIVGLTKEYLKFRMKKSKLEGWISHSEAILKRIRGIKERDAFFELAQAQLYLISGRYDDGKWILDNLKADVLDDINGNVEMYCYYLYVTTLAMKSDEYTADVIKKVKGYYENGYDTYRILWILFYLSADSDSNKSIKLIRIKDAFNNGCTSPIMYLEAINIMNSQPVLLRVLNDFEIQVINFGCKYGLISQKFAMQIADVAGNEKFASIRIIELLRKIYEKYDNDELLTALVSHMIRSGIYGKNVTDIYEKAILRGLRITRLYEFYIASLDRSLDKILPKMVLMYFAYDNNLNTQDKAYLYANIVVNRNAYKGVYDNYEKNIELFIYEQVKEGNINDELAILYQSLLTNNFINNDTYSFMEKLKFTYKIKCFDESIRAVCVRQPELRTPVIYEVHRGVAYVQMYSSQSSVAFICNDNIIRKDSISYEIEKVFDDTYSAKDFEQYEYNNAGVLIYQANALHRKDAYDGNLLMIYKAVLKLEDLSEDYRAVINSWMIEYYSKYYTVDDFWHEYPYISKDGLTGQEAVMLTEVLINFGMYSQAYEVICENSHVRVAPSKLLKLVDYVISNVSDEENPTITEITRYIFNNHMYNENILKYMIKYFNGTNEEMYNLWKVSINFGMDEKELSIRTIAQMLFTGVHSGRLTEVFSDYYRKSPNSLIVKAYVSYNSYLYVVKQKKPNEVVFRVIEDCVHQDTGLPDICYVAWLKELSKKAAQLAKSDKLEMVQKVFDNLCSRDIIFGFYKKFSGVLNMPYNIIGVSVIEYVANPEYKVAINYSINDEQEITTDVMKCNDCGIFTYKLNLFYSDVVKYSFTVNGNKEEFTTDRMSMECNELNPEYTTGRYDAINDCLASKELHDMVTLKKLMHMYSVENYVTKQLFKPMK